MPEYGTHGSSPLSYHQSAHKYATDYIIKVSVYVYYNIDLRKGLQGAERYHKSQDQSA